MQKNSSRQSVSVSRRVTQLTMSAPAQVSGTIVDIQ